MSSSTEKPTLTLSHFSWATIGKFIAAVLNLAALIIYSRMLGPAEFGIFVLAQSTAFIGYNVFYMWAEKSIVRFAVPKGDKLPLFIGGLIISYTLVSIFLFAVGGLIFFILPDDTLSWLSALLLPILLTMLFEALCTAVMDVQVAFSRMERYAFLIVTRAFFTLSLGFSFTQIWFVTPYYFLMGHAMGCAVVVFIGCLISRIGRPIFSDWVNECRIMMAFGYPLSASMVFRILIQRMDRFAINAFLGPEAVGLYSIAFDFARRTLGVPLMIVNLVVYPLMVKSHHQKDHMELNKLLKQNWLGLVAIGASGMGCIWVIAPNALETLFGAQYSIAPAPLIMTIASICMVLEAMKIHHFDVSLLLTRKTFYQIPINAFAAMLNFILLLLLVGKLGISGAAYSALFTFLVSAGATYIIGRSHLNMPLEIFNTIKITALAFGVAFIIHTIDFPVGILGLLGQIIGGGLLFGLGFVLFNFFGLRQHLRNRGGTSV